MSNRKKDSKPNPRRPPEQACPRPEQSEHAGHASQPAGQANPPTAPASSTDVGSDEQVQRTLDDALADSFPASDPVSIVTSQHEEAWHKDRDPGHSSRR